MTLVSVRSTTSQKGLVAILVEDGGPAMVAVPVAPREGLLLSAGETTRAPTWTTLLGRACRALDGRIDAVELDVDADAALCACVVLVQDEAEHRVPCSPAEALVAVAGLSRGGDRRAPEAAGAGPGRPAAVPAVRAVAPGAGDAGGRRGGVLNLTSRHAGQE